MFAGQFKIIIFVNAPEKKTRACPFSSSTPRWKKTTKLFCKEWASKLAESDKGSYYNQEKWLKEDKAFGKPTETTMESVAGEKLQENSRKPYVVDFPREVSNF